MLVTGRSTVSARLNRGSEVTSLMSWYRVTSQAWPSPNRIRTSATGSSRSSRCSSGSNSSASKCSTGQKCSVASPEVRRRSSSTRTSSLMT